MSKILFLSSLPKDQPPLAIDAEFRKIHESIQKRTHENSLEIVSETIQSNSPLSEILVSCNPDIVHFSGHGQKCGVVLDKNGKSKLVDIDLLKRAFDAVRSHIKTRLVILNTCNSNSVALQFSISFYRNIAFGCSIQEAFNITKIDLELLGVKNNNPPEIHCRNSIDANAIFLDKRKGRLLLSDYEAWENYVTVLAFAKQIHHTYQTIGVMYLTDLFSKLGILKESVSQTDIVKKAEIQNNFKTSWNVYKKEYNSLLAELNLITPNYTKEIFDALNIIKDKNIGETRLIELCLDYVKIINGESGKGTNGELDNYNHCHRTVADYMKDTKTSKLYAEESIVVAIQDLKQFSGQLTTSSDNLLKNLILILLKAGE